MTIDARVLRAVETAVACGISPAMAVAVALGAERPATVAEAVAFVNALGPALSAIERDHTGLPRRLAELEDDLRVAPELAGIRPDAGDHALRDKLVFRDLLGKKTFFQVAALAIGNVDLSRSDADLLEQLGINTQLADVRIWPLTVVRRAAARSGMAHGILSGAAVALNHNMGARPVGGFMRVLDRIDAGDDMDSMLARGERIPGVGRPVLGPDERNAQVFGLARQYGRDDGPSWRRALDIDEFFHRRKNQHINSAGLQGAIMRDMGFSPDGATAFCLVYFLVQILAHAVFAEEHLHRKRESAGHAPAA